MTDATNINPSPNPTRMTPPVPVPGASSVFAPKAPDPVMGKGLPNIDPKMQSAWNEIDKLNENNQSETAKQGNVDIYSMPKEFQKHNPVAGSNFSVGNLVMFGSVVLLLLVGAGFLLYTVNPELLNRVTGLQLAKHQVPSENTTDPVALPELITPEPTEPQATSTQATTTAELPVATSTPGKELYLSYTKELAETDSFTDYYVLINKYGSNYKKQQAESAKLTANSSVDKGRATLVNIKQKTPVVTETATVTEQVDANKVTLNIVLADQQSRGSIDFLLEDGVWRLDNESWELAKPASSDTYVAGEDRDRDGLTDKEEILLSSSNDSADSDSDGYTDASELGNLYDPAKKSAKLVDSQKIKTYVMQDRSFSIVYPSQWHPNSNVASDSIVFRSDDEHFVQIIITDNTDGTDLDAFYMRNLQLTQINDKLRIDNDSWQGIMTEDGLVAYILSKTNPAKVYLVQYDPGQTKILEYPALFKAMIKSLVIK